MWGLGPRPTAGSIPFRKPALVAQRIEHLTTDQKVGGSNPFKRTRQNPRSATQFNDSCLPNYGINSIQVSSAVSCAFESLEFQPCFIQLGLLEGSENMHIISYQQLLEKAMLIFGASHQDLNLARMGKHVKTSVHDPRSFCLAWDLKILDVSNGGAKRNSDAKSGIASPSVSDSDPNFHCGSDEKNLKGRPTEGLNGA